MPKWKNWGPGGWQPVYAEILHRCRHDKAFAFMLYTKVESEVTKRRIESFFGPFPLKLVSEG